jgi:hypothetical protein
VCVKPHWELRHFSARQAADRAGLTADKPGSQLASRKLEEAGIPARVILEERGLVIEMAGRPDEG